MTDVFFVDGTAFLLTVARRLKFVTAEHVPSRTAVNLSKHMKRVTDVYERAGFRVRNILMDGEFEKLKPLMPSIECNTTAAKEHVSANYLHPEGADEGTGGDTSIRPDTTKDED